MKKEQLFEAFMQSDAADIAELAIKLRNDIPHTVIKPPTRELVMFRAEESVEKIDFNVGEVLTISAEVRVDDVIGYSMTMDFDEQKALDCALIMAVYEAKRSQIPEIGALAQKLSNKQAAALREEMEIVGSTSVKFEVMAGQDPNVKHNPKQES